MGELNLYCQPVQIKTGGKITSHAEIEKKCRVKNVNGLSLHQIGVEY